ncbi:MAG TPA: glycoside hydrolase family 38 C-terminal domain-containing protein [Chthonomonadales bacterium]|nr:glycoside hydrolase family 38 C-terminal domain-containing protein [Chthonomonadales bacterium]
MSTTVHYVPHTHYDAEVFLTRDETFEIGYSVLLGALAAMRADPRMRFVLDQTCYIEPFLRAHPEERPFLQQMVDDGRLEITCGMHAMPDVNIPSGEAFIRQVMAGKSWCERELGVDVRCGWLLDTFGQHPQIPQLMRKSGFDHNVFQRIGTLDGPTEYWWRGIDGTTLFCHWMRGTYCVLYHAPHTLREFRPFVEARLAELRKHALTTHLLAVSGADLAPIEPHVADLFDEHNRAHDDLRFVISTPNEYFEAIRGQADFPTIEGDLNPVFQGCYSARIAVKQWNRRLESRLCDAEIADAAAVLLGEPSQIAGIDEAWLGVLFNQFHDILCGSHVDKANANVIDRYKVSAAAASACLERSLDCLAERIDTRGEGVPVIVMNPLGWERDDPAECRVAFSEQDVWEVEVRDSAGRLVPSDLLACERYVTGGIKRATLLFLARGVPALGCEVYRVVRAGDERPETDLRTNQTALPMADMHRDVIENEHVRVEMDAWNGAIVSLVHKATGREYVRPDLPFAGSVVRELDNGNFWEYNGHCKGDALLPMNRSHPLPSETDSRAAFSHHYGGDARVTCGRARCEVNVGFAFGGGLFATRVRLYAGLPRVEIHTTLVNADERVRYRAVFPTPIEGGAITQEIPFGAIERPEGEFPAQTWMDYADAEGGLLLLNRGLPGNSVERGVMMLALLKCTALKEGYGEVGGFSRATKTTDGYEIGVRHAFDYAVLPHAGDWRDAQAWRRGAELNRPLVTRKAGLHDGPLPPRVSLLSVSAANVAITALRAAPDGGILARLYEAEGRPAADVRLTCAFRLEGACETDLLGKGPMPVAVAPDGAGVQFDIGPFEIKTFVLRPA